MDAVLSNVMVVLNNIWTTIVNTFGGVDFSSALNNTTNNSALKDFWNGPVWNNYYYIIVGVLAIFVVYKLIGFSFSFMLNGILGCIMLVGVNWVGGFVHFTVPVNIITALIAGIFGIPGIVAIVIYYVFF